MKQLSSDFLAAVTVRSDFGAQEEEICPKYLLEGLTDAEAEAPLLWPPQAKSQHIRKDPDVGKD